jgi:hypothetical protein
MYDNGQLCNAALWHDRQGVLMTAATFISFLGYRQNPLPKYPPVLKWFFTDISL